MIYKKEGVYQMEILKMTERKTVVIQTVEKEERNTFDIGKIRVAALPPIAKKDLIAELKSKGFCDGMIHTAMQCRLEDLNGYVNVWKYVAYILAVEQKFFVIHLMNTMTYVVNTILKIAVTVENTLDLVGHTMTRIM